MRALRAIIAKDLRLLWRDRAGLIFLTVAPIMVITVAGFSLANLYGADPTGQTAYAFPFVDEDGSQLSRELRRHLEEDRSITLEPVQSRARAAALVRSKRAGSALVVPQGTEAALVSGAPASLILYVDPVKYLERLNVRARLLEVSEKIAAQSREALAGDVGRQRQELQARLEGLQAAVAAARQELGRSWEEARAARERAKQEARAQLAAESQRLERQLRAEIAAAADAARLRVDRQLAGIEVPIRIYLETLEATRGDFEKWLGRLREMAGSHAAEIPPPPAFPEPPPELMRLRSGGGLRLEVPAAAVDVHLPPLALPEPPALPPMPDIQVPQVSLPAPPVPPSSLHIEEVNLTGGPSTINTFDQNVPGFSVTFLLLGMLLGVSLGLLDERDWGTLDRLRAMPVAPGNVMLGKLLSRFAIGCLQMAVLFAVGWAAFGISLGPQPWALALPTAGIVFAGTAFGLIVAAVATSREAVLPVGSIVIVTMAAVGGCWWPIDLEPRWMRTVALGFPTTWAMDAYNDLMIRRRLFDAAVVPTAVMLAYGLAYLVVGMALFRYRLQHRG